MKFMEKKWNVFIEKRADFPPLPGLPECQNIRYYLKYWKIPKKTIETGKKLCYSHRRGYDILFHMLY